MFPNREVGLAMIDVLVALLLLALTLTGACLALVQATRATHDALLATHAADLAADISEELRHAGSPEQAEQLLKAWRGRVVSTLPVKGEDFAAFSEYTASEASNDEGSAVTSHMLRLRWEAHSADRELALPVPETFLASP